MSSPQLDIDLLGKLQITIQDLVGQSVNIIGLKRSGKSTTAGVWLENWSEHSLPATVVDPQNEWYGLKERYPFILAGKGQRSECPLNVEHAADLAAFSFQQKIPVILSLVGFSEEERFLLLKVYFERLWQLSEEAYEAGNPQPYAILLEEARKYIPQTTSTPVKQVLRDIVLGGGKYGLTTFLVSQRAASIDKDVLSQASFHFLHKVLHKLDKDVYKSLLPLPESEVERMIQGLGVGDAIVMYSLPTQKVIGGEVVVTTIRDQWTFHGGSTPTLAPGALPQLKSLDSHLLDQLREIMTHDLSQDAQQRQIQALTVQVQELEALLHQKDQELEQARKDFEQELLRLRGQIELLSVMKLTLAPADFPSSHSASSPIALQVNQLTAPVQQAYVNLPEAVSGEGPFLSRSAKILSISESAPQAHLNSPVEIALLSLQSEQESLGKLLRQIRALDQRDKTLFLWLVEHDNKRISSPDLARNVHIQTRSLYDRPPQKILCFPFIVRSKQAPYWYQANVRTYCRQHFSSASDIEAIIQQFCQAASVR